MPIAASNLGGWQDKAGKALEPAAPAHLRLSWNLWKKVLKQVAPSRGIARGVANYCNAICNAIIFSIMKLAAELKGKKATISSREIQSAVRLLYPGEIAKHAVSEGTKAVVKATSRPGSVNKSCGLTIPPTKVKNAMKAHRLASRHSATSSVYLAAVLEYTMAEIFELAHNAPKVSGKWLTTYSLNAGIAGDDELKALGRRIYFDQNATQLREFDPRPEELVLDAGDRADAGLGFRRRPAPRGPFAKATFGRCCREVASEFKDGIRFRAAAIEKLQIAAGAHLARFVENEMKPKPTAAVKKAASPFASAGPGVIPVKANLGSGGGGFGLAPHQIGGFHPPQQRGGGGFGGRASGGFGRPAQPIGGPNFGGGGGGFGTNIPAQNFGGPAAMMPQYPPANGSGGFGGAAAAFPPPGKGGNLKAAKMKAPKKKVATKGIYHEKK